MRFSSSVVLAGSFTAIGLLGVGLLVGRGSAAATVNASASSDHDPTCDPTLEPARLVADRAAIEARFTVKLPAGCSWHAQSRLDWLHVEGTAAHSGSGEVSLQIGANAGADRIGVIAVGDAAFVVVQRGKGPVTAHPRLWLRAEDLPRLRRWATAKNPMWSEVVAPRTEEMRKAYDEKFFPGGRAAAKWPDPATGGDGPQTETAALQLAFHSLVSPDARDRDDAGRRARALLMHVMDDVARGGAHEGFREDRFANGDRFRGYGQEWALTVDWIYPRLSKQDLATIRKVFFLWADLQADHSQNFRKREPRNDRTLVANRVDARWPANNWQTGMGRNMLLESLALDDVDDPAIDPSKPATAPRNSLRALRDEALGSVLYQQQFLFGPGGDAAGGVPPEGAFEYGAESTGFLFQGLLALVTSGYVDPQRWGSGLSLLGDRYLHDVTRYYPHGIAPIPDTTHGERVYPAAIIEQTREWAMVGHLHPAEFGPLGLMGALTGDDLLRDRARWLLTEPLPGGPAQRSHHARTDSTSAVLSFLLHDPALPAPRDYRTELGRTFYSPAMGRLSARTGWGADARWLHYTCTWKTIDHQIDLCGSFMFWRKGEWITDPRNGYSDTNVIDTPDYHNAFAIQHGAKAMADWEKTVWERGGQTRYNQGDPRTVTSQQGDVLYVESDATHLHNQSERPVDVTQATRALVWLRPDTLVIYDRANTGQRGRRKAFWLNFPGKPQIAGSVVSARTAMGQAIRLDVLWPTGAAVRERTWEADPGSASIEPMIAHVSVEDPTAPADARFLHVLQAFDRGGHPLAVRRLEIEGGRFQGAVVGTTAVLFPVAAAGAERVSLSYAPGADVTEQVITGLVPGDRYDVRVQGGRVDVKTGSAQVVDAAGLLVARTR